MFLIAKKIICLISLLYILTTLVFRCFYFIQEFFILSIILLILIAKYSGIIILGGNLRDDFFFIKRLDYSFFLLAV